MHKDDHNLTFQVDENINNIRLDQYLAQSIHNHSRNQIQQWIKNGHVQIDDEVCMKPKTPISANNIIQIHIPKPETIVDQPENIPLDIAFEDSDLIVINKPPGLVVHPGAGNRSGTLLNAILHHDPTLATLPRAGIVHRLDKDTSGLMMIAKKQPAYLQLCQDLAKRQIKRQYLAIVDGQVSCAGNIDEPIGRSRYNRQKMAVTSSGKPAQTSWTIRKRLQHYTLIDLQLHTGRTHQIRVHMQHLGHPLLGDPTYGSHRGYKSLNSTIAKQISAFPRQALHAIDLQLIHPIHSTPLHIKSPVPDDMQNIINLLDPAIPCK
ncbi:MAG: RluA family pseudouridine synthase [Pseudomonadota bacterium]|nr:RluA family pseudouridine synthase [Pseudomonadota bacterium]MEC8977722.1 RluA family pseudouridine synthase [Pseudomonadota bacterium]